MGKESWDQCETNWLRKQGNSACSVVEGQKFGHVWVPVAACGRDTGRGVDAGAAEELRNRVAGELKRKFRMTTGTGRAGKTNRIRKLCDLHNHF
jgi:hypothetical protein